MVLWLRVRFTRSHKYCCFVLQQKQFLTGRAHHQLWLCHKFTRSSSLLLLVRRKPINSGAMLHYSREQWRHSPLFWPDSVRFKAKNALNWVRPSKIKKYFFIFNCVFFRKTSIKHYSMTLHKLDGDRLMM